MGGQACQKPRGGVDLGLGTAELAFGGVAHRSTQGDRHRLQAIADAEDGYARTEQGGVRLGCAGHVDALGTAGQYRRARPAGDDLGHGRRVRDYLAVDPGLAHPPGDKLGVLGPVIDHQHGAG